MNGFLIRRCNFIVPGCGGTSTLARGAKLAARCLHEPQPISIQWMGAGCPHCAGRYPPEGSLSFSSQGCWSCRCMKGFLTQGWDLYPPRVRRDLDVDPRGNSRSALAP